MEQTDYYRVLGVGESADAKQIKEAYRELAFKYHPDRNKENPAIAEKMKEINEAYAVLSNPQKKSEYDALRQQFGSFAYNRFRKNYSEQDIFSGCDILSVFEEMTKNFGFRGYDEIFREFYGQGYRTFEFKKPGVFVKGFVFSGRFGGGRPNRLAFPVLGNLAKLPGYILKKLAGVELPEKGSDVNDVISLAPQQAREGGPFAYFHRKKSKRLVVKIPPGVRDGQRIRLAEMGEAGKGGGKPGDLYLKVHIKRPVLQRMKDFIADLRK